MISKQAAVLSKVIYKTHKEIDVINKTLAPHIDGEKLRRIVIIEDSRHGV